MGLIRNSRFYNYTVNLNGDKVKHGNDYHKDYFTDLIANDTIDYIRRLHDQPYMRPYMIVLSFPAPHGPEDPAPQFSTMFNDVETHRTDSWNYAPNPDKQWLLQHTGRMEPVHVVFTDVLHRRRLQTLQSVDHNIQRLINELRNLGDLSNTYFIYTSDHGYHLGQFGLVKGKNMPYEFDIRVPYFIRGPGLPKNITIREPVMNVDIAPTILDIAGVPIPAHMDGRSLLPLINHYDDQKKLRIDNSFKWRNTVLIERGKMTKLTKIRDRLLRQRDRFSKEARVQKACARAEFRAPCQPGQQWKCVRDKATAKWRIYNCQVDLDISKQCECAIGTSMIGPKRRYRRSDTTSQEKLSIRRVATIAQLDAEGEAVDEVDEHLSAQWEQQFLNYIGKREILESGHWFQGVFDELSTNGKSSVRSRRKRVVRADFGRRRKVVGDSNEPSLCIRYNTSVQCKPIVYEDSNAWMIHKAKVDDRIESLRRKLLIYKDMRKTLKRHRPINSTQSATNLTGENDPETECHCSRIHVQPLRSWHTNCNVPQMNCFLHGADHWRTPPLWPHSFGDFCFCQNSNNNTYWCLRTLNTTHNFLYCEFITEFVSFYDLNLDPAQLENKVWSVPIGVLEQLSAQLELLRTCSGHAQCEHYSSDRWISGSTDRF